ncbi:MAG: chlororespiratory reduction protein 7 [Leptolyngbyaceae cyanobacterium bins.349]|nr:chlororespiratory reduction protein 7 [Leptolyngbyaceae cyanobacterium bins.349]
MVDPRLYKSDTFVLLEPDQPEQFLSTDELRQKLEAVLATRQADLPRDLQRFPTVQAQAQYLLESCCDFDVAPGQFMQWYMVRLEK